MVVLTNLKSLENKANTAISLAVVQNAVSNYSNTARGTYWLRASVNRICRGFLFLSLQKLLIANC